MKIVRQAEDAGRFAVDRRVGYRIQAHHGIGVALTILLATALGVTSGADSSGRRQKDVIEMPPGTAGAAGRREARNDLAVASRKWGLAEVPIAAPAPPGRKPSVTFRPGFEVSGASSESLPPVFTTIPVQEKVVFLTIDDGAEKDPEFLTMIQDLRIPYTVFLSDYVTKENYSYFKVMQKTGVSINNHTLNHRNLPGLSYEQQLREICGQQDTVQRVFGKRPILFRPPYGAYNRNTLMAAKYCGIKYVPLWNAEAFPDRIEWRENRDLHPGDIILTHFRGRGQWKGSMADLVRHVMRVVTSRGYAIARLEDYLA
ncbi:polysaccharide deacetylase family protein [Streptomyces lavendulae]|uniref:polysaccharide deacetylase family protein n=1 Tax=Streptomyces lavendulae TaxID=1914 RepID=UPI00340F49F0